MDCFQAIESSQFLLKKNTENYKVTVKQSWILFSFSHAMNLLKILHVMKTLRCRAHQ